MSAAMPPDLHVGHKSLIFDRQVMCSRQVRASTAALQQPCAVIGHFNMRRLLTIGFIFMYSVSFCQTYISFKGNITWDETDSFLSYCEIILTSSSGLLITTKSDSTGFYSIDSVLANNDAFVFMVKKDLFFAAPKKIRFNGIPHDTIVNFQLTVMPVHFIIFPDIHFYKNSVKPKKGYKDTLNYVLYIMENNPTFYIKITGFKDSSEKKDKRLQRIQFIRDELIKSGIDNSRIEIVVSDEPCKKYSSMDYNTGMRDFIFLTEKYILSLPRNSQSDVRQLNQCVTFEITKE